MTYGAAVFEILVAGPRDVSDLRTMIAGEMNRWNDQHARSQQVVLLPVRWESHTVPQLGNDAQALIIEQLDDRCDAVIAVFGDRLGTATPRALSGTAEEILHFHEKGRHAACYFSRAPVSRQQSTMRQVNKVESSRRISASSACLEST